jgi:Pectate lyase superfamily protein
VTARAPDGIRKDTHNSRRAIHPRQTYNSKRSGIHNREKEGKATMPEIINSATTRAAISACAAILALATLLAPAASAQGSRHDDIVLGTTGHPVAGATVRVCQATATGTPCTPLATIYTSATLATTTANPFQSDGLGNYHFYAPAGRYMIQLTGPGITGTVTQPDLILPPDVSSTGSGNNISAFGLNLGGNLSVAGNATITGTLTSGTFSPGTFAPTSIQVTGNGCFAGPRPYIDVTCPPYGAKGDGVTNDTTAITNAINAACGRPVTNSQPPPVAFPPGSYLISQTQGSSTTPDLPACGLLHLIGLGNGAVPQFGNPPLASIVVAAGASPSAAPAIGFPGYADVTLENLAIEGYNQALSFSAGAGNEVLKNVCLTAQVTGQADNTPLKISNTIWFWWNGGCSEIGGHGTGTLPPILLVGDSSGGAPGVGLAFFRDLTLVGGAIHYSQRTNGNIVGALSFDDITGEDLAQDFLLFTNDTGNSGAAAYPSGVTEITINDLNEADMTGTSGAVIEFAPSGTSLTGVTINHAQSITNNAILMSGSGSSLQSISIKGCFECATGVVDGSGNPYAAAERQNFNGSDFAVATADPTRLRTDVYDNGLSDQRGPAWRLSAQGTRFAGLAADPVQGILFGDGLSYGWTAQLLQSTKETLDIGFSQSLPPTGVTATAASGGTLANGTYYYAVVPLIAGSPANCNTPGAGSLPSSAVTTTTGSNTVNITWTASASGASALFGYCVLRSTVPDFYLGAYSGLRVSGAGSTTASDTGSNFTSGMWLNGAPVNPMQAQHRFTPTSLGVNTTNPQYNLDVNGTAAVNSLNGVQMAERFTGSDAAAKINACLTAASTSSGVCSAMGLTGSLTGASRITIPAGTTLLWGQAQLTINDTTNNDAVELLGDGSSLISYQESGAGTVPRADASGFIACLPAGCTAVKNPNAATRNVDWVHITGMYLKATGAASKVLDLTSVGHADIENNRLVMGTGGGSYGVYGDTSTGGFDSTNTLIKHNEFDPQFQNDRCLHLAGVFNVIEMEQNTCVLPAANTGTVCFELAKDSGGNYPNNDEFYGNDCEGSSTSFGQIGYNIINADSVTIGPNNRCENVYNCFQFPTDGSAVGIHVLDPYISVSANSVVKANEPSTAQVAIDNNGPNWLPSMHYGLNDVAGRNLLGNAAFEGWSGSTALYYWGGVTGTSINQAGSGIYAQQSSASAPADATTQGTYNVKIGDNATAGLGVNSGCVQIDATMNYTLAFRIASTSTGINFRPGFRFYSDPNCTEADKITNVATNARVLAPSNYAGTSTLVGTGPNWQSSNASLTYNNGITCNCNVTGADWQVATASAWTPTRNFAITFRVPNAYSSSTTVAQSMRVFILENTAANPNQIFVDDAVLSQGPVSPNVPLTAGVSDSANPAVYGNLAVAGNLTVGASALPATLTSGTPVAGNCAAFTSSPLTNVQDSGSPCPSLFTKFAMGFLSAGQAPSATNAVDVSVIYLPNIQFSHLTVDVSTTDASTSDFYSWAITDASGSVKCSITPVNVTSGGASDQSCTQGTVTLPAGTYVFAFTGNATTGKIAYSGTAPLALSSAVSSSTSASGAITFPLAIPSAGVTYSGYGTPAIILH